MNRKRSKWSFAIGCTGRDMCYTLVSLFLLTYIQYTNLVNTSQFLVLSVIIVLCRIWDAVNDPMMGTIISNTKTKFGKYRPWILIGCILNAVILVLMFSLRVDVKDNIDTLGWYNVAILGTLYLLYGMTYTANDVSYWSLLPVLSESKEDRDNLTTMVAIFASIGAFVSGGIIPMVTPGNMIVAYRIAATIFAVIFLICQVMVFFLVHDNKADKFIDPDFEKSEKEESLTLKGMLKILFRNKQLLYMAVVVLLYSLGSAVLNAFGQNFFYFKFGYNGNQMFIFTVMYAVGTLVAQAFYPVLAKRFSRNQIVKASIILLAIGYVAFFIIANLNINDTVCFTLLSIFGVAIFLGQGIFYMVMLIMLANTIEYDEWQTGERNDAITFSVRPFMVKLASAIQYGVVAVTLVLCGMYSITEEIGAIEQNISTGLINKEAAVVIITNMLNTVKSGQMLGLTFAMTIIPIILFVFAYIIIKKKYIIDEAMYDKMIKEIESRKSEKNV